jgi:hypothetical protein
MHRDAVAVLTADAMKSWIDRPSRRVVLRTVSAVRSQKCSMANPDVAIRLLAANSASH